MPKETYQHLPAAFKALVPEYKSKTYTPLHFTVEKWHMGYGLEIAELSEKRFNNRLDSYLIPEEMERVKAKLLEGKDSVSIRFGRSKEGHGYHGDRGDFCLVGGTISNGNRLHLFYRSLELIGGFGFDVAMINVIARRLGIKELKSVTFYAVRANVFALKRNSNEKLYPKLRKIFGV